MRALLATLALALVASTAACTENNPLYCTDDAQCKDSARPYCDVTGAFGEIGNRCIAAPDDTDMCDGDNDCTMDGEPICDMGLRLCRGCDSDGDGDAECADKDQTFPTCADDGRCVGCVDSADCPATGTPICGSETCGACTEDASGDAACAGRGDGLDRCLGGSCVACRESADCPAETPVCDDETHACRTCEAHGECESDACNPDDGTCVATGNVIYVAATGADDSTCGDDSDPCKTVSNTDGALDKISGEKNVIRIRPGNYVESIWIRGGETVTLYGSGDTTSFSPPIRSAGQGWPVMWVENGANATVFDLVLANAGDDQNGDGIRCANNGTLRINGVTIRNNDGTGIEVASCASVTVERSDIRQNTRGGIKLDDTPFTIVNNFITNNGDVGTTFFGGVSIRNSGVFNPHVFEFNTVANNRAMSGAASSGVECDAPAGTVARNNIVWGGLGTTTAVSGTCGWESNNLQGNSSGSNLSVDPMFVSPSPPPGDFHLMPGSPVEGSAEDSSTILVDNEGDPRPQGTGHDMGADEISP